MIWRCRCRVAPRYSQRWGDEQALLPSSVLQERSCWRMPVVERTADAADHAAEHRPARAGAQHRAVSGCDNGRCQDRSCAAGIAACQARGTPPAWFICLIGIKRLNSHQSAHSAGTAIDGEDNASRPSTDHRSGESTVLFEVSARWNSESDRFHRRIHRFAEESHEMPRLGHRGGHARATSARRMLLRAS